MRVTNKYDTNMIFCFHDYVSLMLPHLFHFICTMMTVNQPTLLLRASFLFYSLRSKIKAVRQSQIVQSVIYGCDTAVMQVLSPALLSTGSQLGLFPFAKCE